MGTEIRLGNAFVCAENGIFTVASGKSSMSFSFDRDHGFVLTSLKNSCCERDVEYLFSCQPLNPMTQAPKRQDGVQKSNRPDLVNAVYDGEGFENEDVTGDKKWSLVCSSADETLYGGARVLTLTASVTNGETELIFHGFAFPFTSVIRYYFEIKNLTSASSTYFISPFKFNLGVDNTADIYDIRYFKGGIKGHDYGRMFTHSFGARSEKLSLSSHMTSEYVPLVIFSRDGYPRDGLMVELDYIADWSLEADRKGHEVSIRYDIDSLNGIKVEAGETAVLPSVTVALYGGDLDDLMVTLYDWQYRYLWDYTNNDYYAVLRDQSATYPWAYCSRVLHEQFAYRLYCMDMLAVDTLTHAGIGILWDDAGWSSFNGWPDDSYGTVFKNTYEGPDHRLSTRFLDKHGMKRLIWFGGKPSVSILRTKEGAWGEFEWRTDDVENDSFAEDRAFRDTVVSYLDENPRRSFHTCSGGARFCNTFDLQRYANYHYMADNGVGPDRNYYYSYFALPDKWGDLLPALGGEYTANDGSNSFSIRGRKKFFYNPDHARANLSMCGLYGPNTEENCELIREDAEIYRYLVNEGLAGRFSYMFHPGVYGDKEVYYVQRTSNDRSKACIIIRRRPNGRVRVYPKGLIEDKTYMVSFDISNRCLELSGKELMDDGILLTNVAPRELIYIGIEAPRRRHISEDRLGVSYALCKREANVGVLGMGIYWSCLDSDAVSYYEIYKNGQPFKVSAVSRYCFDTDGDESDSYAVRAVAPDGKTSGFASAELMSGEGFVYTTLGSHGEKMKHFRAETSTDLKTFDQMTFVPAERNPGADFGGTPNQRGGIEGYFEGEGGAKIGRGWMQASPEVYCVRTFVAPLDGKVRLSGRAMKEWYHTSYGSDVDAFVMKNGDTIISKTALVRGDIDGLSYDMLLDVKKGDVIRFVLGKSKGEKDLPHYEKEADVIGWNTVIAYEKKAAAATSSVKVECGGRDDEKLSYTVPVGKGVYAIKLGFNEQIYKGAAERFMKVVINGSVYERALDIVHDARGAGKEMFKVYRHVLTDGGGNINVDITSLQGGACIDSIEIAPENNSSLRINCGGEAFVDWVGYVWESDRNFDGGEAVYEECYTLEQASPTLYDKRLYFSGRSGESFGYSIPINDGIYSIQLKFAELENESRPAYIYVNGVCMKRSYDPIKVSNKNGMTADLRFEGISPVDGRIDIKIVSIGDNSAILRAIEID